MATTYTIEANKYYLNLVSSPPSFFTPSPAISLAEGDLLKINSDQIQQQFQIVCQNANTSTNPNFQFPIGSLVGTLDNGKTFFAVENHLEMMVLDGGGNLSLTFWGCNEKTQKPPVNITIEVEKQKSSEQVKLLSAQNPAQINYDLFQDRLPFEIHANGNAVNRFVSNLFVPEPLLDTDITVLPGDLLLIDTYPRELWSQDLSNFVNSDGIKEDGNRIYWLQSYKSHNYRIGSLIGTIDEGNTFFPVGTHLEMIVLNPGKLRLCCWDCDYDNNVGSITAFVKLIRNGENATRKALGASIC